MVTLNTLLRPSRLIRALLPAALVLLLSAGASAIPMVAPPASFDGSETMIDFGSVAQDVEITTQIAGITVSGGLFGDTSVAPGFFGTGTAAANFQASSAPFFSVLDFSFDSAVERFRFNGITNGADDVELDIISVGGATTTLFFDTSTTVSSLAVQDVAGILGFQLRVIGPSNNAFAMDSLEYATLPEPSLLFLLLPGTLAVLRRREA